jgi:tRNA-dihydrouridine synthase B
MQKETSIGKIKMVNPLLLAPMDGISDYPFRMVCKIMGADIVYSEFVQAEGFLRGSEHINKRAFFDPEEKPFAIQLYSGNAEILAEAVKKTLAYKPDIIDLNFGCWKPDIVRRNAGAGMLRHPDTMVEIARICADICGSADIPLTIKTRLGWDFDSIIIEELTPRLEEAGIKALTLHCRTKSQAMGGDADWSFIPKVKKQLSIPLFLNGDVFTAEDAKNAMETEGCDGVMIGRGAIGNPFIFKQAKKYIETGEIPELISIEDRIETCKIHLNYAYKENQEKGLLAFRKHYSGYLKDIPYAEEYRKKLVTMKSMNEIENLLDDFYRYLKMENLLDPIEMKSGKIAVWRLHHKHVKNDEGSC